jgi:hypothetical protein
MKDWKLEEIIIDVGASEGGLGEDVGSENFLASACGEISLAFKSSTEPNLFIEAYLELFTY